MPFARRYESWEVRRLLQSSEGAPSPVTTAPAHARNLHAMTATAGRTDTFRNGMMHRTHKAPGESNNQFRARGGAVQTSAFNNLLFQAAAVMQAFNSPAGQAAFAVFDDPAHAGQSLRLTLDYSGITESGFGVDDGTAPGMQRAHRNAPALATIPGASGVRIIIDRGSTTAEPFVQTCFPLDTPGATRWSVVAMPGSTPVANG